MTTEKHKVKKHKESPKENKMRTFNLPIYEKMPIPRIIEISKTIEPSKIAIEVLNWIAANVENFIDNQTRTFKLDLIVDTEEMPETKKLQDLYRAIPDDDSVVPLEKELPTADLKSYEKLINEDGLKEGFEQIQNCRQELDKITKMAFEEMKNQTELLEKIFKRMIFFYEMVGISRGKVLVREMAGAVQILNFEYEAFSVAVNVTAPSIIIKNQDGNQKNVDLPCNQYTIPEGFSVWIEISYIDASRVNSSMF